MAVDMRSAEIKIWVRDEMKLAGRLRGCRSVSGGVGLCHQKKGPGCD